MFKYLLASALLLCTQPVLASSKKGSRRSGKETLYLMITNLSVSQPFAPFFVMSHDDKVDPLFTFGSMASDELASLAETGSPEGLIELYANQRGVLELFAFDAGFPYMGGETLVIEVDVSDDYPYISLASMAINTNDCFVAINGIELESGDTVYLNGLDAGSEENNELCKSIPGPACAVDSGNEASGNGEGFVHVHPGIHGLGDLADGRYDWRNPMVQIKVL